jgi:hypothetical protein
MLRCWTLLCTPLLLLLLLVGSWRAAEAKIVGVWTDIEDHNSIVGDYLRNATAIAPTPLGCGSRWMRRWAGHSPPTRSTQRDR